MLHQALGVAAVQIGWLERVFVLRGWPRAFVNPRIVRSGGGRELAEEACLSLPGVAVSVVRDAKVWIEAVDERGQPFTQRLAGDDARAFQHELDHLDGILIIDRHDELVADRLDLSRG